VILFKAEHVPMIRSGRKTQTRRTWDKCRVKVGSVHIAQTGGFGKGAKQFARLLITGVRRERLGDITEADAKAEGYPTVSDYKNIFASIYGRWTPDEMVWVVDFERIKEVTPCQP
jgi:hypothetical protein